MSKRMAEWGRRESARLKTILNNRCYACGATQNLTFDCLTPTGHNTKRQNQSQRMCFYRRQFRLGNLGLLCGDCNRAKGKRTKAEFLSSLNKISVKIDHSVLLRDMNTVNNISPALIQSGIREVSL